MPASETLELLVNLKGTGIQGLKDLQAEIRKVATSTSPATTGLKKIRDEAQQTEKTVQTLTTASAGLKKTLVGIGSAIGFTFGVGALVIAVKNAISTFAEFDDTMRQVKAISGATNEEFAEMTELAKKMGETTRFTATDSAQTMRILAQAGFSVSETMKALPAVMTLASAGMVDLSQAAEISSNAMNSYGLAAESLPSINNVLVRAINQTNADLSDLGTAFAYVAPIARGLGADFEDLVGALGLLHNAGLKGSMAGTSLRGILDALFTPTKEEAEMMEVLGRRIGGTGLQIRNAQGQFIGFLEIVKQLEKAGMSGDEALRLFGARAGPGMAAMLNIGSGKLSELNGFLRETDDLAGKTAEEMEAGLGGAMRQLRSAVEAVQIAFGDAFGDLIKAGIVEVKNKVLELVGAFKQLKEDGQLNDWAIDLVEVIKSITTAMEAALAPIIGWGRALNWAGQQWRAFKAVMKGEMTAETFVFGNYEKVREELKKIAESPELAQMKINLKKLDEEVAAAQEELLRTQLDDWEKLRAASGYTVEENEKYIEALRTKLTELQAEWGKTASAVTEYGKRLNKVATMEEDVTSRAAGVDTRPVRDSAAATIRNIGRAGARAGKTTMVETDAQRKARDAAAKAAMAQAAAEQKEFMALIENSYAVGLVAFKENISERIRITNEFYEQQKQAAIRATNSEIAELTKLAKNSKTSEEKIKAEGEIVQKRKELSAELIQIETRRYQEEIRLAEEAKEKRIQIENTMKDIKIRMQVAEMAPGVDREFTEEKLRLDEKHRLEMEALKKLTDEQSNWNDLARTQELEKQRLHEDQVMRLRMMQLDSAKQVTGGIADLFENLYEATGKETKAFFYIAKAAAIAQATINIAQGVTKAIAEGGWWGIIQGAAVAAAGAAQLAKISSQQLAGGGLVEGRSPSTTADDKLISATSGEYMHPVKAVRHYGVQFMNAVRDMTFPRDIAAQFASRYPISSPSRSRFAEGGMIGTGAGKSPSQGAENGLIINNFIDPNLFGQYLTSNTGKRQLINVIGDNKITVRNMLFNNG